jgi:hypothetical protein
VNYLANMMFQVHPDVAFRDKASTMTQKATAVLTALSLNRDVYNALAALTFKTDVTTRYPCSANCWSSAAGVDKDDATTT